MKKSVCIAAYHGEKFLAEQLESILSQLDADDEIVVSDDNPGGATQAIAEDYARRDSRVRFIEGRGEGVQKNFENAMKSSCGDVIFLCDQDDVWLPEKVSRVMKEFDSGAALVLHDARVTDENLNTVEPSFFAMRGTQSGFLRNLVRNTYMGCCMAFTREIADKALPFPSNLPMHDQWIGLCAERCAGGKIRLVDEPLILYRRHGKSITGRETTVRQKLVWRKNLLKALLCTLKGIA